MVSKEKPNEWAADAQRRTETKEESSFDATRKGNWRKSGTKKGVAYQFKTFDEVIAEGGVLKKRLEVAGNAIKVIDMTGKEQKVYSGYEAYAAKTRAVAESEKEHRAFDVPELTYNLNALLDMTEETIRRNNHQRRFLEDQTTALENDRNQLNLALMKERDEQKRMKEDQTTALENDRNQLNLALMKERDEQKRMKEVLALLEGFSAGDNYFELTLEKCRELFEKLQKDYLEEYRLFNLEEVAVASVLPLIQKHFSTWDPLDKSQVDYGFTLMAEWKKILESEDRCVLGMTRSLGQFHISIIIQKHFSSWDPLDKSQVDYGFTLMAEWKKILESEDRCVLGMTRSLENLTPFERLLWDGWMPSIRRAALKWNPRDDTHSMLSVIDKWLPLLPIWMRENLLEQNLTPFERLLWDGWMPSIRRAALKWNPRDDTHSMLSVVDKWLPLLPIWMRENLLEQVIIPRISSQVDEWNPLVDHVPIHTWMHPWLDIMGDRLQPVFSPIRQKLAKALREWNPTDHSAVLMLRPWKGVFAAATMSAFLAQNITPKLEKALKEMNYDPTKNKRYDEFYATLAWVEMLGNEGVAAIFVRSFFPKVPFPSFDFWFFGIEHEIVVLSRIIK
uniref:GCFC domain-containing protein n=1 Tax=Ascaris lumbricoides TaxID=6252 RepID=A0A0M3IPT4_ASCLU